MKTNIPKLKIVNKNKTQHPKKSNAHNKCYTRHNDIEYVFMTWRRVYSKKKIKLEI